MARGTIKKWIESKGFGYITPEAGGRDVRFYADNLVGATPDQIREGAAVEYTERRRAKSPTTQQFRLLGVEIEPRNTAGYRFYNPYNFVRPLGVAKSAETPAARLMDRCTPPPHDRYIGHTGRITVRATTTSPLFVSDSGYVYETDADRKADHRTYEHFKFDFGNGAEHAVPASSLRGMLRSTFETVTNSCFAHFDYGSRLSYHLAAAESLKLVPARVEYSEETRKWSLRLLPGIARLTVGNRPDKLYAGRVERYEPLRSRPPRRRRDGRPPAPKRPFQEREVALDGMRHGDECFAIARELKFPPVLQIREVSTSLAALRTRRRDGEALVRGFLCVTNQNIENKRFERFFVRDARQNEMVLSLSDRARLRYGELIRDYQKRHQDAIKKARRNGKDPSKPLSNKDAGFSRFMLESHSELRNGDLVYAQLSGTIHNPSVEFLVPVAIPRVSYDRKVSELLLKHLHKCDDADNLCPACRTFGWTYGRPNDPNDRPPERATTAYSSRVRLSHAKLVGEATPMGPMTLSILGSPKPTTTRFYLQSKTSGRPRNGLHDAAAGYDNSDNMLRGRKVYRHHPHVGANKLDWSNDRGEHIQVNNRRGSNRSDQNRTIADPLPEATTFEFTVDFDNLAEAELGALLYAIQLESEMHHRLGFGKPLGLGSLQLQVTQLERLDVGGRYSAEATPGFQTATDTIPALIDTFKTALATAHNRPFDKLPNIADLKTLLSSPAEPHPIHYPRSTQRRDPEGKNFEWFMGNNRNRELRLALSLPGEDKGLPLINKRGDVQ